MPIKGSFVVEKGVIIVDTEADYKILGINFKGKSHTEGDVNECLIQLCDIIEDKNGGQEKLAKELGITDKTIERLKAALNTKP